MNFLMDVDTVAFPSEPSTLCGVMVIALIALSFSAWRLIH